MEEKRGNTFILMGALMAFIIGSGFTSGQEILQYFVPFGYKNILVGVTVAVILVLVNLGFIYAGKHGNFKQCTEVYSYFCGPVIGRVFEAFAIFFNFALFIAMLAGASSTLNQQYGISVLVGAIIAMILICLTVSLGLKSIVNIIGTIAPVLTVFVLFLGTVTLVRSGGNIAANVEAIQNGSIKLISVSSNWFMSGLSIAGLVILQLSAFSAELGAKYNFKKVMVGHSIGIVVYCLVDIFMTFALISRVGDVYTLQIPNLGLANEIWPVLGTIFGIIIFGAIYTTCCPLLWTICDRFSKEKTVKYNIMAWAIGIAAVIVAVAIPFNVLINWVYRITGYVEAVIVIFMMVKFVNIFREKRKQ